MESKRRMRSDLNIVFGIASMELGATTPKAKRSDEVKQNLRWLREVKRETYAGLGLSRHR